jgi:hypothetical protein
MRVPSPNQIQAYYQALIVVEHCALIAAGPGSARSK